MYGFIPLLIGVRVCTTMATKQSPEVEVSENSIKITNFEITDPEVVDYLEQHEEEDRITAISRALRVGVLTMGLSETSQEEEFVKRSFNEMRQEMESEIERIEREIEAKFGRDGEVPQTFDEHLGPGGKLNRQLEEAFGDDGAFVECLNRELGEDGKRIQDALDPDREGTPTHRLRTSLREEIRELRDKIEEQATEEKTREEIVRKTPLKGQEFEEKVYDLLSDLVYGTSDEVKYTANKTGSIEGREVGDFVLELNDTGQRIAVEAKSDRGYSQREIKEELEDAIANRDADYGIIIFECESYIPNKVGYFHEFDDERLSIALSQDEEDDIDPAFLRIGFNWARTRTIQNHIDSETSLDPERIQTEINEIEDSIDRFSTIRTKSTRIKGIAGEIDTELESIEGDVKSRLVNIRMEMQSTPES